MKRGSEEHFGKNVFFGFSSGICYFLFPLKITFRISKCSLVQNAQMGKDIWDTSYAQDDLKFKKGASTKSSLKTSRVSQSLPQGVLVIFSPQLSHFNT